MREFISCLKTVLLFFKFWRNVPEIIYDGNSDPQYLNEKGEKVELNPGDKLHIPAGAIHAEGEVEERMVYIVGISEPANLLEKLTLLDPKESPLYK